jgi:TetR/AcrR family transcriptional regulator, repressor for neighboring sulfatase
MATRVKPPARSATPRGRDAVVDAVLDAAERLFATSGPAAVSLRDVATEADVTYSLINRHFGTKDALVDRLLERYALRWTATLGDDPDYGAAFDQLLGATPEAGAYLRLLAWSLLNDDDDAADAHRRHALLDRLPALRPGAGDQEVDTALALSLVFGWRFFSPFIRSALHLDEEATGRIHEAVRRATTGS